MHQQFLNLIDSGRQTLLGLARLARIAAECESNDLPDLTEAEVQQAAGQIAGRNIQDVVAGWRGRQDAWQADKNPATLRQLVIYEAAVAAVTAGHVATAQQAASSQIIVPTGVDLRAMRRLQ